MAYATPLPISSPKWGDTEIVPGSRFTADAAVGGDAAAVLTVIADAEALVDILRVAAKCPPTRRERWCWRSW